MLKQIIRSSNRTECRKSYVKSTREFASAYSPYKYAEFKRKTSIFFCHLVQAISLVMLSGPIFEIKNIIQASEN